MKAETSKQDAEEKFNLQNLVLEALRKETIFVTYGYNMKQQVLI